MIDLSKMTLKVLEGWQDHYRSRVRTNRMELNANCVLLLRVMAAIHAKRQAMAKDQEGQLTTTSGGTVMTNETPVDDFPGFKAPCAWKLNLETYAWDEIKVADLKKGDVYHIMTPHPSVRDVCIAREDAKMWGDATGVLSHLLGYSFVARDPEATR